jgi:hypothetical protein
MFTYPSNKNNSVPQKGSSMWPFTDKISASVNAICTSRIAKLTNNTRFLDLEVCKQEK